MFTQNASKMRHLIMLKKNNKGTRSKVPNTSVHYRENVNTVQPAKFRLVFLAKVTF